ncbi:myotilin [Pelodytes ibericus]
MNLTSLPSVSSMYQPSMFNYERPKHFIQSQPKCQGDSDPASVTVPKHTSISSIIIQPQSSNEKKTPPVCSSSASVPPLSVSISSFKKSEAPGPPRSNISLNEYNLSDHSKEEPTAFQSVSPFNNGNADRNLSRSETFNLPKSAIRNVPKPVQQMSDRDIKGTKDALIQDLERKLKSKDDIRHNGNQRLSYEERMARRLLGPQNAASVFEDQSVENIQQMSDSIRNQNQPPKARSQTSTEGVTEHGSIQEKCFPPRFLQVPENLVVEEGRFCRINFKVTGLPNPDVTWYLNGRLVQADDLHKMIVSEKGVHSFIFEVVRACDGGLYECIASNRAGKASFTLQLDVLAQECKIPPYFIKKPAATRAYEGDNIQMECKICASPQPEILLKKNNEMLQYNTDRIRLLQDSNGAIYLFIYDVKKSDDGWYTISAVNEAGIATCHARLDVGTLHNKHVPTPKQLKVRPTFGMYSTLPGKRQNVQAAISPNTEYENSFPAYAGLLESDEL